mgnify:CR=1 FL=1
MSISSTIKSIQDIMRKDVGVDGDAQCVQVRQCRLAAPSLWPVVDQGFDAVVFEGSLQGENRPAVGAQKVAITLAGFQWEGGKRLVDLLVQVGAEVFQALPQAIHVGPRPAAPG